MAEPWFRMHANPGKLKVTARLMEFSGCGRGRAVGALAMFWGAISQHCPGGSIENVPDSLLEDWAEWDGKRGVFAAFVRQKHSTQGVVNEYDTYSGALEDQRERDRLRKADVRRKLKEKSGHTPEDVPRMSAGSPTDVPETSAVRYDTIRNERTTKASASPVGEQIDPVSLWVVRLGEDWHQATNGSPPYGRIGKDIKPLIVEFGEARVRAAWQTFVLSEKRKFGGPTYFAQNFSDFEKGVTSNGANGYKPKPTQKPYDHYSPNPPHLEEF